MRVKGNASVRPLRTKDVTGKRFGRLIAREFIQGESPEGHKWICDCDCGKEAVVKNRNLKNGSTRSCGCLYLERSRSLSRQFRYRHGMSHTKIHQVWNTMLQRCSNPNVDSYDRYGGRGIQVFEEWKVFEKFYEWATKKGYKEGLSIDRIDPDGNYEPSNCRWIPVSEQPNNRRNTRWVEYQGERMTIKCASKEFGMSHSTLYQRLFVLGWSVEKSLTEPVRTFSRSKTQERIGADI